MTGLRQRLAQLRPSQRAALARRLEDGPSGRSAQADPNRHHLVAYVVLHSASTVDAEELRRQLGRRLPEYMVPSSFVFLDSFPCTPNGKLDQNALPDPTEHSGANDDGYVEPSSDTESTLAEIWADVLGFDSVGVRDNFFEMGGDSLLSIRVIARAAEAGICISAEQFVHSPSIEEFAATVATGVAAADDRVPYSRTASDTFAATDFPLADLDQDELDHISDLIDDLE